MRTQEQIIVKRGHNKRSHAPKGGGAWKVAFADFTLAMMSLFLVLWILAVSSQTERTIVATHLRDYSLLDNEANPFDIRNSPFPIDLEGKPSVLEEIAPEYKVDGTNVPPHDVFHRDKQLRFAEGKSTKLLHGKLDSQEQMRQLAGIIGTLAKQLQARDNLTLQIVPQGLRIQIRDDDRRQMFARGSVQVSPYFHQLLRSLAPVFSQVENRLMISGHTDSVPYPSGNYTNWELSGDRAQMARRVLLSGGLPEEQIAQVVAMGDTALAKAEDPTASENRRIELLVLNSAAEKQLATLFASNQSGPSHSLPKLTLGEKRKLGQTVEAIRTQLAHSVSSSESQ